MSLSFQQKQTIAIAIYCIFCKHFRRVYLIASGCCCQHNTLLQKTAIALCHAELLIVGKRSLLPLNLISFEKVNLLYTANCSYCRFITFLLLINTDPVSYTFHEVTCLQITIQQCQHRCQMRNRTKSKHCSLSVILQPQMYQL